MMQLMQSHLDAFTTSTRSYDEYLMITTPQHNDTLTIASSLIIMEPLRGGALAGKLPEAISKLFAESGFHRTPVDWALRWLFDDPRISVVLSGMSAMEHVVENLQVASAAPPGLPSVAPEWSSGWR